MNNVVFSDYQLTKNDIEMLKHKNMSSFTLSFNNKEQTSNIDVKHRYMNNEVSVITIPVYFDSDVFSVKYNNIDLEDYEKYEIIVNNVNYSFFSSYQIINTFINFLKIGDNLQVYLKLDTTCDERFYTDEINFIVKRNNKHYWFLICYNVNDRSCRFDQQYCNISVSMIEKVKEEVRETND